MILIDVAGLKTWRPLSRSGQYTEYQSQLSPEQFALIDRQFPLWLCELLKSQINHCIKYQVFPTHYAPLSQGYAQYKKAAGLKPGFWQATDFLRKSLAVWQNTNEPVYHIGFPPHLKHPKSGLPVAAIAQRLENGDKARNLPPRPLFIPVADKISKSIRPHFTAFMKKHHPNLLPLLDPRLRSGQ